MTREVSRSVTARRQRATVARFQEIQEDLVTVWVEPQDFDGSLKQEGDGIHRLAHIHEHGSLGYQHVMPHGQDVLKQLGLEDAVEP